MAETKKENWFKRTWGKVCKFFRELKSELKKVVWPTPKQVAKYFRELRSELKKVVWPTPQQVLKNALVVVGCVVCIGIFIWLFDFVAQFGIDALISAVHG